MEERKIEALRRKLFSVLKEVRIVNGHPDPKGLFENGEPLYSEVLKTKKEWIGRWEIINEILKVVNEKLSKAKLDAKFFGNLSDVITRDDAEAIWKEFEKFYVSIPSSCYTYYPLKNFPLMQIEKYELSDSIGFFEIIDEQNPNSRIGKSVDYGEVPFIDAFKHWGEDYKDWENTTRLLYNTVYLKVVSEGYLSRKNDSSANQNAYSKLKQFIMIGIANQLLIPSFYLDFDDFSFFEPKFNVVCFENLDQRDEGFSANYPVKVEKFISKLELEKSIINELEAKPNKTQRIEFLDSKFKTMESFFLQSKISEETNYLNIAMDWAFESCLTNRINMKLIQICLALEAVLGAQAGSDKNKNEGPIPLTFTLADRCAYLIGLSLSSRNKIRQKFIKLYQLRSKIVHGKVFKLNDEASDFYDWAWIAFLKLLREEIYRIHFSTELGD